MTIPIGERTFSITVTDQDIIDATVNWNPLHADAPTEHELSQLRRRLDLTEMLGLHWLRNRYVQLRKKGLLSKKELG